MANANGDKLQPHHATLLRDSAVSDAVADARGYRTVTIKAELGRLGFGRAQCRVPTLLIPIWDVRGEIAFHQHRPDSPRVKKNGKPVKYETCSGVRMALDVHPFAKPLIGDPKTPLFVTEGSRKADSAVSIGLCSISLLGVWNWRGTNEQGGRVALPDWDSIALKERTVYIAFDSDVMLKPEVHEALARLKAFLESRHAEVSLIYLTPNPDGSKVGLDDYIAADHNVEDLLQLASKELRGTPDERAAAPHPYLVKNGHICFEKDTNNGPVIQPLCNFDARIVEELTLDDGDTAVREFVVNGKLDDGRPLSDARVPSDRFSGLHWILDSWGVAAVPAAGMGKKDQLREAILRLSEDVKRRRIFTHTGWREIDGQHFFLSSSGAVGRSDIEVDLSRELARYDLPRDPENVVAAVQRSVKLLGIATLPVGAALLAAVYRAPLASVYPLDLVLWLEGITGSLKSSIVAVFLSHFGDFARTTLPGSWSSTVNLLEKRSYTLKDALFVVDDYAPNALDFRELRTKASLLLRAQGNLAGRGRLRSDLRERRTFHPRGMIISTGEEGPPGQSILARSFLLDLERRHIDLAKLSEAQANTALLPHAMAAYVTWLAPQIPTLHTSLSQAFQEARNRAVGVGSHLRQPEALAHLWIGLDCFVAFAEEIKAIDSIEAADLRASCWEALVERAEEMGRLLEEEKPTRRFAEILAALLVQKKIVLLRREAGHKPGARDESLAGWNDDEFLYLVPEVCYRAVNQFARESGEPFPVGQRRLRRDLVKEGIAHHDGGRTTTTVRLGGRVRRVLRLRRSALSSLVDQEFPDLDVGVTDVTGVTGFME